MCGAGAAGLDLRAELLVSWLERPIDGAVALADIVDGDPSGRQLGRRCVHHRRERVIEHGDPVRIVPRVSLVDVAGPVIVVRPPGVRLVIAGDFLGDALAVMIRIELDDGLAHHAATVTPVRELAGAELDVGHWIHEIFPGHAANVAVRAAIVLVEQATDGHQSAVLRIDLPLPRGDARGLFVHVAFVDHDGQQQRGAQIVTLRRGGDGVGDAPALRRRPGGSLPANFFLHRADRLGEARIGVDLAARIGLGVGG